MYIAGRILHHKGLLATVLGCYWALVPGAYKIIDTIIAIDTDGKTIGTLLCQKFFALPLE